MRVEFGLRGFIDDLLEPPRITNALLLVAVFYFNFYVAMPKLYFKRKYMQFMLTVLLCFNLFFLLNYFMMPSGMDFDQPRALSVLGNSFNLFMFIIVYTFSFALCLYGQWEKMKEQMLASELAILKAQIDPHFLFNTLNSIYSLALTKSDATPNAIIKLSALMRYCISESNNDRVPLQQEINYITNYIDLQKLRLTSKIKMTCEIDGHGDGKYITPFLLIPFIENAFKHGVNSEGNSDIKIKITINKGDIVLEVANNKVYLRQGQEKNTDIGISSTRRRLNLLYPGKHVLDINDGKNDFIVYLKIDFQ